MKPFLGAKGAQSCTGRSISPFSASQYRAVNGNSRTFATNPSSVQRCTNARCLLSRSNRHEEFRNENPFWVQKTHKAVQAGQYHRSLHRSIVHSIEICVHSQLILARYKGCTNARFILSRSYGHEEFRNANPFWVQKTHKAVQAGQYHRSQHRSTVPSMENRVFRD